MDPEISFYTNPDAMEPLFPEDRSGHLEALAADLISKAGRLSGILHPITQAAIADFLRPMNSYYSNLIEGHDTHPIDIARALKNDFSMDPRKRNLQMEARAHIMLHAQIAQEIKDPSAAVVPSGMAFLLSLHKRFYDHLPEEFLMVTSREGNRKQVVPGTFRIDEVEVGRHIAPAASHVQKFMERFSAFYNPATLDNRSKIKRIITIAASHHRLAWIHPFLDGNGRVVRLFSDACFMFEHLDSGGLWSISRGLARNNDAYISALANADLIRYNDYDGRGNLSNKMLVAFCAFFLHTAIDQIEYMYQILDIQNMLKRIHHFTELMVARGQLRREAKYILEQVFLKGCITKSDAMRITGVSDKTLKLITDALIKMELLSAKMEGVHMVYYVQYPIAYSPMLFPGLYPGSKEAELFAQA